MIDEYFDALKARIEAGQGLAGRVYGTVRHSPDGSLIRDNYVVLYTPAALDVPQERFTQVQTFDDTVEFDVSVKVVAVDEATARRMLSRVVRQLTGHMLEAEGRQPSKVVLGPQRTVKEDPSVKPFLYVGEASFEWTSRPA